MKKLALFTMCAIVFCSCSTRLYPVATPDMTLDPKENMLSSTKGDLKLDVKVVPQSYAFYGMEDSFVIFFVKAENTGSADFVLSADDFVLLDDKGHQVNLMKVEDVAKIVEQNLFYLIPYPYIGYYSEGTNYYEGRYLYNPSSPHIYPVSPRDLFLEALTWGKILPKAHLKGKIYFKKKISEAKKISLKAVRKNNDFLFSFNFENK